MSYSASITISGSAFFGLGSTKGAALVNAARKHWATVTSVVIVHRYRGSMFLFRNADEELLGAAYGHVRDA